MLPLLLAPCTLHLASCGDDTDDDAPASDQPSANLTVSVEPSEAAPGSTVEASVVNETEKQFTYGAGYELDRIVEGGGTEPVKLPPRPIPEIGYVAQPGESGPAVIVELPSDLSPGAYMVVIQRDLPGVGDLSGDLQIVDR